MGIAERRYRQKEEVRTLILETAWKIILEDGVNAFSIRKVADAVEYSVPVIYTHFESKDVIMMEFVGKGYVLLVEKLEQARDRHRLPTAQLEAMAQAYWDFAFANPEYYQLMFGLGIPSCETARKVKEIGAFGDLVISVIRKVILGSKNPEADCFLKYHTYWSILHGIISIRMNGCAENSMEISQDIMTDAVAGFIFALQG